jgi:cellulose biosynthesis protein BcsQ
MKKPTIIADANPKGGVVNNTTIFNLGYELSQYKSIVLLFNMDAKTNLTMNGREFVQKK